MNTFGREFDRFIKAGKSAKKWKTRAEFGRITGLSQPFMSDVVKGKRAMAMETLEEALMSSGMIGEEGDKLKTALSRQKASESAALAPLLAAIEEEVETLRAAGRALIAILDKKGAEVPESLRKLFQPRQ